MRTPLTSEHLRSWSSMLKSLKGFVEIAFDTVEYITMRAALYGFMAYGLYKAFLAHH